MDDDNKGDNLLLGPATASADDFLDNFNHIHNLNVLKNNKIDVLINAILDNTAYYIGDDKWQVRSSADDIKFLKKGEREFYKDLFIYARLDDGYRQDIVYETVEETKNIVSEYEISPEEYHLNIYDHYGYWESIMSSNGYAYNAKSDDLLIAEYFWADHNIAEVISNLSQWGKEGAIKLLGNSQQFIHLTPDQIAILEVLISRNAHMMILGTDIGLDIKSDYLNSGIDLIKALHSELILNTNKNKVIRGLNDILTSYSDTISTCSINYHLARIRSLLLILSELRSTSPKNGSFYKVRANIEDTSYYHLILKKAGLKKVRYSYSTSNINPRYILKHLSSSVFEYEYFGDYLYNESPGSSLLRGNALALDLLVARVIFMDYLSLYIKGYFDDISATDSDDLSRNPIYYINNRIVTHNIHKYISAFSGAEILSIVRNLKL